MEPSVSGWLAGARRTVSTKCCKQSWIVRAVLPTPPSPKTTNLYKTIFPAMMKVFRWNSRSRLRCCRVRRVLREPGRLKKWTEGGGEDCSSVWR